MLKLEIILKQSTIVTTRLLRNQGTPNFSCTRLGQRKTQTSEVGFWNTNTILIKQKVKCKEGCGSLGN